MHRWLPAKGILISCIGFLATIVAASADIRIDKPHPGEMDVYITGLITAGDAKQFERLQQDAESNFLVVHLNSRGGNVDAALSIGRIIRNADGETEIDSDAPTFPVCLSSCALIFIAGVHRSSWAGTLGLHRPYLAGAPQTPEMVEKEVPQMLSRIKSYVAEMGVTNNFYQEMVNTDPSNMLIYKGDAFKKFIPEYDPVYEETEVAWDARRYGISTTEMRQRDVDAERCDRIHDVRMSVTCSETIKWGLSESVYSERFPRTSACNLSSDDRNALQTVPMKLRSENPIIQRREACIRNIMLGHQ